MEKTISKIMTLSILNVNDTTRKKDSSSNLSSFFLTIQPNPTQVAVEAMEKRKKVETTLDYPNEEVNGDVQYRRRRTPSKKKTMSRTNRNVHLLCYQIELRIDELENG